MHTCIGDHATGRFTPLATNSCSHLSITEYKFMEEFDNGKD